MSTHAGPDGLKRVVVTGMGLVTPLARGREASWRGIVDGRSGIGRIDAFETEDLAVSIAGSVPRGPGEHELDPDAYLSTIEQRRQSDFILYAIAAADEALDHAGWRPEEAPARERTGVLIGSGIGGLGTIADTAVRLHEKGPRRVSPFMISSSIINEAAGAVAIRHRLSGPTHAVVTACASGAHAIGDAARMIQLGDADVMIAGGAEAGTCRLSVATFAIMRALSTAYEATPEAASRPWDRDRDGFVLGEGAGIVVLESLEHAQARGATIHGELLGYGLSGDAYHATAPDPNGAGAARAMKMALSRARLDPSAVGYLNAHATSTPAGDPVEIHAIKTAFGAAASELAISSTKSATGHTLGAAGAIEAIFTLLALRDQVVPPTLNLDAPDEGCDLDLVPHTARERRFDVALSNSFGFGGANAALVFGRPQRSR